MAATMTPSVVEQPSSKTSESARFVILREIDQYTAQIAAVQQQIQSVNDEVQMLQHENVTYETTMALVAAKREVCERRPHDIPVEDAMDTLFRLENVLKRLQLRNAQFQRDNAAQERTLRDKNKQFIRAKAEHEHVVEVTGYHQGLTVGDAAEIRKKIEDMGELEQVIERELAAAQVVIRKKEQLVVQLVKDIGGYEAKEEALHALFNKIRVLDRDTQEVHIAIRDVRSEDKKNDTVLQRLEDRQDRSAIIALEGDRDFLREEVERRRVERKSIEEISKAQQYRMQQLYTRIDILNKALKDMNLDRELERSVSRTQLATAVQLAHPNLPSTIEDVLPANETVPIELYDLLARDNKIMNSIIARKDVLSLEKASTLNALQAKVNEHEESLRITTEQQDQAKIDKVMDMQELDNVFKQRHGKYRSYMDDLVRINQKLKYQVKRKVMCE